MTIRPQFLALVLIVCAVTIVGLQFNLYHYAATASIAEITKLDSFSGALAWVKSAGYFLMFIAMVIEGPVITAAAAFAVALGYFNFFIVLALSIAGDLVADFAYYAIGHFGRVAFVEKHGHKVGLTQKRMEHMERLIKTHPKKTIAAIKLTPVFPVIGLMMIGAVRMPFKQYSWMTFLVSLPKSLLFMIIGYYFGRTYNLIAATLQNGEYFIVAAIAAIVIVFYAYKKLAANLSMRLEAI